MNRHEGRRVRTMQRSAKAARTALDKFWACCDARAHLYAVANPISMTLSTCCGSALGAMAWLPRSARAPSRRSLSKHSTACARGSWPP